MLSSASAAEYLNSNSMGIAHTEKETLAVGLADKLHFSSSCPVPAISVSPVLV